MFRCNSGGVLFERWCAIGLIIPGASPAISGKVGGQVFSRNRYGAYARAHVVPVNPQTAAQSAVRATFGTLSTNWVINLDAGQRAAWSLYGANTTVTNRIGVAINLSGNAMYVRANSVRLQAGLTTVDDGPSIFTLCTFTQPIIDSGPTVADTHIVLTLNPDDEWQAVGGGLTVYVSPEQNPSINFYKGKFIPLGVLLGGTVGLGSHTFTLQAAPVQAGNKLFFRGIATAPDGRPSQDMQFQGIIQA